MKHPEIQKDTKIFYHGDMANQQGFGIVTGRYANEWGDFVDIKMEDGREKIRITIVAFSDKYLGNGLTRFVTRKAYNEYRNKLLARMRGEVKKWKHHKKLTYKKMVYSHFRRK